MRRDDALTILAAHKEELVRDFRVKTLAIFGSVARDEARPDSDVDVLVEFDGGAVGLFELFHLQARLSELLGRDVDVVEPEALKAPLRARILDEAVHAA